MLELRGLGKSWPDFSLAADFELGDGQIAAILGPSGCGKSTLLRLISGLERPDRGAILLDGRDVSGLPPDKRGVGLVFQGYALFPGMSVRRNIEYGPKMRGTGRAERAAAAEALAASFEIGALLDRSPANLSGGEQQRVALARALAAEPGLVLLDEPLSSLDAGLRRRLRSEIAERLRAAGVMALHVTHDVEEAFAVADRVILMGRGRVVESGSPEELYARPRTAYGARFLGRGPVLPAYRVERSGGAFVADCALGRFRCAAPAGAGSDGQSGDALAAIIARGERLALFFPAESARIGADGAHGAAPIENRVRGRVLASSFAGRFRRLRLACGLPGGAQLELEIEAPLACRPAIGEELGFRVEAEDCLLLPEADDDGD